MKTVVQDKYTKNCDLRTLPLFVLIKQGLFSGLTPTILSRRFVNALLHMLVPAY